VALLALVFLQLYSARWSRACARAGSLTPGPAFDGAFIPSANGCSSKSRGGATCSTNTLTVQFEHR
jgi:hypothetical protein